MSVTPDPKVEAMQSPVLGVPRRALRRQDTHFWQRWVAANALGELVGLGAVAAIGLLARPLIMESEGMGEHLIFAFIMVLAGGIEGVAVGYAQWRALRHELPTVHRREWVGATVVGALIAWGLGMMPSVLMGGTGPDGTPPATIEPEVRLMLATAMGAALGAVLAFPQIRVLRSHLERSWLWAVANAVAWAVAMPIIFAGIGAVSRSAAATGFGTLDALFLLAMITLAGLACGAINGAFLVRMIRVTRRELIEE
jgi:hypothetical protein